MGWQPGDRIGADLRLLAPLASTHRCVWRATRSGDDQKVVVTFAHDGDGDLDHETRSRFALGAKRLQELDHENILSSYGFGVAEGIPYTVSPEVAGEPLALRLRRERVLPQDALIGILRRSASALAHAHDRGIVHGCLTPDHILATSGESPEVWLTGFEGRLPSSVPTFPASSEAPEAYAAPEVDDDDAPSPAADGFSLAAIAYHGLLGRPWITDVGPNRIPATELSPFLPETIDRFFERALADAPEARFDDVIAMVDAFERALGGLALPTESPLRTEGPLPNDDAAESTPPSLRSTRRGLDFVVYFAVALAALLAGAAIALVDGFTLP